MVSTTVATSGSFEVRNLCGCLHSRLFKIDATTSILGGHRRNRRAVPEKAASQPAAKELVSTKRRIVDIALDYQFESQQTFTRAFKQATWLTPGEARRLKKLPDFGGFKSTRITESGLSSPLRMRGATIFTNDVEALTSFYNEVVGLPILDADPSVTQLDARGSVLVLHQGATPGAASRPGYVQIRTFSSIHNPPAAWIPISILFEKPRRTRNRRPVDSPSGNVIRKVEFFIMWVPRE